MKCNKTRTLFVISIIFLFALTSINVSAKEKKKTIGNFKYTYVNYQKNNVWITEITPLSEKGIQELTIPEYIGGRKVVKLGNQHDNDTDYGTDNVFGMWRNEENWKLLPKQTEKKVKNIKKIVLPKSLEELTPNAFSHLQKGKTIHILGKVVTGVPELCNKEWKKVSLSKTDTKYKIQKGILLSRDGETMYALASQKKKVVIPKGVKKIEKAGTLFSRISYVYISESVRKIDFGFTYGVSNFVSMDVSDKNPCYVVLKNCLVDKKTGSLIVASTKKSTFRVPSNVKCIDNTFFAGKSVNRIIIPPHVKKVGMCWGADTKKLSYVFESKFPPILENINVSGITLYVPKGCKERYRKAANVVNGEVEIYEK